MTENSASSAAILHLINEVYSSGQIPLSWQEILHISIPKKGDLSSLTNWQAICLTNHIVKIMNNMILNRIQPIIEPKRRNNQFGFRPLRSTVGAQAILTEIIQKALRGPQGIFLGFVDFKGAFPSISHGAIAECLTAFSIPPMLNRMILATNESPTGYVKTQFGKTENFEIASGVLQGDVLAPFIFVMCLDRILELAMQNPIFGLTLFRSGTKSRGVQQLRITDVDYADDIVFFSPERKTLQEMLVALTRVAERAGLKLNIGPSKTAWMVIGGRLNVWTNDTITLGNYGIVPRADSYRYLGHMKHSHKNRATLQDRIQLAWRAFHRLKPLWREHLSVTLRLRIFNALVTSVLSYGLASLVPTGVELKILDTEVNKMRRIATGTPLWDGYSKYQHVRCIGENRKFQRS